MSCRSAHLTRNHNAKLFWRKLKLQWKKQLYLLDQNLLTVFLDDFNAHVNIDSATWRGVVGQQGGPNINKNGRFLLQFCTNDKLCITNTFS